MRGVYYSKILMLLLYLLIIATVVNGAAINKYANYIAKWIFMATSLPFEDCGSKYLILNLDISSCNTIPCVMRRGTNVEVNVIFNDDSGDTIYLKHRVRWIFNTVKTRASITPDPCDGIHKCLSNDHEGKLYSATLLVNKSLPAISGIMLWEAINEYNEDVICFRVPVVIIVNNV